MAKTWRRRRRNPADVWEKRAPGRRHSTCKGPVQNWPDFKNKPEEGGWDLWEFEVFPLEMGATEGLGVRGAWSASPPPTSLPASHPLLFFSRNCAFVCVVVLSLCLCQRADSSGGRGHAPHRKTQKDEAWGGWPFPRSHSAEPLPPGDRGPQSPESQGPPPLGGTPPPLGGTPPPLGGTPPSVRCLHLGSRSPPVLCLRLKTS